MGRKSGINHLLRRASILHGKGEQRTAAENRQLSKLKLIIGGHFDSLLPPDVQKRYADMAVEIAYLEEKLFGKKTPT